MSYPSLVNAGFLLPGAYEGAQGGGRLSSWRPMDVGPNLNLDYSVAGLRARQRQQTRDNPIALSAREQYVINVIGAGMRPNLQIDDLALKKKIMAVWQHSALELDADGQTDFAGMQATVARGMFDGGSILARARYRRIDDDPTVPLQIQILESDFMDSTRDQLLPNGGKIKLGIQLDPIGQREGYWLRREHPGDSFITSFISSFVPANQVAHVYKVTRPGQLTGVPHLHSALVSLYELDKYTDAEIVRKQQAAMHVGAITNTTGEATPADIFGVVDPNDPGNVLGAAYLRNMYYGKMGALKAGSWNVLAPGDEISFNQPADVGPNYEAFLRNGKRDIAIAAGITYEQLTGDMSNVNYSSARVRLIDIRRGFEMDQQHVIAFQFCRKVWAWWLDAAVAGGLIDIPNYASERFLYVNPQWVADPFEYVDPVKDLAADISEVRAGFTPHQEKIIERGNDPSVVYDEIERANQIFDKKNFVFDTDARRTNIKGIAQFPNDPPPPEFDDGSGKPNKGATNGA